MEEFIDRVRNSDATLRSINFSHERKKGCIKLTFTNKLFIYFFHHIEHSERFLPFMYIRFFDYHGEANSVGMHLGDMDVLIQEKVILCIRSVITLITSQDPTKREYARFRVMSYRNRFNSTVVFDTLLLFIFISIITALSLIFLHYNF